METQVEITQMFQDFATRRIEAAKNFIDELNKFIKKPTKKFIGTFSKDIFTFVEVKMGGKIEERTVEKNDLKKILGNSKLYRYEYRKDGKNLRFLFVMEEDGRCIFLKAFVEDGGKKKGDKSYNKNIELALKIYEIYKIRREEIDERER